MFGFMFGFMFAFMFAGITARHGLPLHRVPRARPSLGSTPPTTAPTRTAQGQRDEREEEPERGGARRREERAPRGGTRTRAWRRDGARASVQGLRHDGARMVGPVSE